MKTENFKKGDRVSITVCYDTMGSEGVIVGQEVWVNRNKTVVWDGNGDRPVYFDPLQPVDLNYDNPRWLVKVDKFVGNAPRALRWRERCEKEPHDYPFLSSYQMHNIAKEELV